MLCFLMVVTYHGSAEQGEHIDKATPQDSTPGYTTAGWSELTMMSPHLAVLFEPKSFAENKAGEDWVVITGNCLPTSFHHKVPCKKVLATSRLGIICTRGEEWFLIICTSGEVWLLFICIRGEDWLLIICTRGKEWLLIICTRDEDWLLIIFYQGWRLNFDNLYQGWGLTFDHLYQGWVLTLDNLYQGWRLTFDNFLPGVRIDFW